VNKRIERAGETAVSPSLRSIPNGDTTINTRIGRSKLRNDCLKSRDGNVTGTSSSSGTRDSKHDLDILVGRSTGRPASPGVEVERAASSRTVIVVELDVDVVKADSADNGA
jgi:hypothetical protein